MKSSTKGLIAGCVGYAVLLVFVFWLHFSKPADEFILLGIAGLPLNLIFFWLAKGIWSDQAQLFVICALGFIQYGGVGYLVGKALHKGWSR